MRWVVSTLFRNVVPTCRSPPHPKGLQYQYQYSVICHLKCQVPRQLFEMLLDQRSR
jgi:hypothetical protein